MNPEIKKFVLFSLDALLIQPILNDLLMRGHRIQLYADRKVIASLSIQVSEAEALRMFDVNQVSETQIQQELQAFDPQVLVCGIFNRKIPECLFALAKVGAFNIHPAALPQYAGAQVWGLPIRYGETRSALTLHKLTDVLDGGAVCEQIFVDITPRETYASLCNKLRSQSLALWRLFYDRLCQNAYYYSAQASVLGKIQYHSSLRHQDVWIDFKQDCRKVDALIRSLPDLTPALCFLGEHPLNVLDARQTSIDSSQTKPGTLVIQRQGEQLSLQVATATHYLSLGVLANHQLGVMCAQTFVEKLQLNHNESYRLHSGFELAPLQHLAEQPL